MYMVFCFWEFVVCLMGLVICCICWVFLFSFLFISRLWLIMLFGLLKFFCRIGLVFDYVVLWLMGWVGFEFYFDYDFGNSVVFWLIIVSVVMMIVVLIFEL